VSRVDGTQELKIVVAGALSPEGLALLQGQAHVVVINPLVRPDVAGSLPGAQALIVGREITVDLDLLGAGPQLRVIGRIGTSVENIDVAAATSRGIVVMNTPGTSVTAMAEHVFALLLSLVRQVPRAHAAAKAGASGDQPWLMGRQLAGRVLGLVGLDAVARLVAVRAKAFGMEVVAADPYATEETAKELGLELLDLEDLIAASDIVSLHPPTRGPLAYFGRERIQGMKPGAILVSIARPHAVDEAALAEALSSGHLYGAALDGLRNPSASPLLGFENVIITPRLAAFTEEARKDASVLIAEQVLDALRGIAYRNAVNLPFLDADHYRRLRPLLGLAEAVGRLQGYLADGRIIGLEVEVGKDNLIDIKPITVALLCGLLSFQMEEGVSYVNAPLLAEELGISVTQVRGLFGPDYTSLVACRVSTSQGQHTVVGALFHDREPRIVQIDGFRMDALPRGHILLMMNQDVPGVIGRVGTLLGEAGINIAEWRLGRMARGGQALSFINLDDPVPETVLEALRGLPEVTWAEAAWLG
jgi:D-3-phosphoglycerate dehydrogenase